MPLHTRLDAPATAPKRHAEYSDWSSSSCNQDLSRLATGISGSLYGGGGLSIHTSSTCTSSNPSQNRIAGSDCPHSRHLTRGPVNTKLRSSTTSYTIGSMQCKRKQYAVVAPLTRRLAGLAVMPQLAGLCGRPLYCFFFTCTNDSEFGGFTSNFFFSCTQRVSCVTETESKHI